MGNVSSVLCWKLVIYLINVRIHSFLTFHFFVLALAITPPPPYLFRFVRNLIVS